MPELRYGAFGLPWTFWQANIQIFVFRHTIAGVTYDVAVRLRVAGSFVLIDWGVNVPGRVLNSALAAGSTYNLEVNVAGATYPLEITVTFPANELVLTGMGRATFLDGNGLAVNQNAITIDGFTDCVVRNLSVRTQAVNSEPIEFSGSRNKVYDIFVLSSTFSNGIVCHGDDCWIERCYITNVLTNGIRGYNANNLHIVNNICNACAVSGIHLGTDGAIESHYIYVEGNNCTTCGYGISITNNVEDFEVVENFVFTNRSHGIWIGPSSQEGGLVHDNWSVGNGTGPGNWHGIYVQGISYLEVTDNRCHDNDSDGIHLTAPNCNHNYLEDNICHGNGRYGINIGNVACTDNFVGKNYLLGNTTGCINDIGTDTRLPEVTVKVTDPDGSIGTHPAIVLTDGVPVTVRFEIQVPSRFQELVRARVVLVPGGAGNLRRNIQAQYGKICAGEAYNAHDPGAVGIATVAGLTANELECIDVSAAITLIDEGDAIGLEFTRNGDDALDTIDADCYLLKFNMQYV